MVFRVRFTVFIFYETEVWANWILSSSPVLTQTVSSDFTDLLELRELVTEAKDRKYPDSPLLQAVTDTVTEAEKCSSVAAQLLSHRIRTRYDTLE